ncbi:MAG: glutaredoxin family protein [Chloroflexi bacterium]|nr:glutaredoxin family protein [Chloroflexota bacterium]
MAIDPTRPVLTFFRRAGCTPCDEARELLAWALEERAARGEVVPRIDERDVATDPDLERRYGALVPVIRIADAELPLVTSGRQLRAFLTATLPATM